MSEQKIVVLDGARTPVGSYGGVLSSVDAYQLGGAAIKESLVRTGVDRNKISDVIMGQVGQVGPDAYNARRTVRIRTTGEHPGIQCKPPLRVRAAGGMVCSPRTALGWLRLRGGRRQRIDVAHAILGL